MAKNYVIMEHTRALPNKRGKKIPNSKEYVDAGAREPAVSVQVVTPAWFKLMKERHGDAVKDVT